MRIGDGYAEVARLDDGTEVRLRQVRPDDKDLLSVGFLRLSPESRYRRFFAAKERLTASELRYLTELDGVDHLALCALTTVDGREQGAGVARFIRSPDDRVVAEAAIAVADDLHGRGLGRLLLSRLAVAARERGIERFRSDVLARNDTARALLRDLAPQATAIASELGSDVITVETELPDLPGLPDLPDPPPAPREKSALFRLLALFARLPSPFD